MSDSIRQQTTEVRKLLEEWANEFPVLRVVVRHFDLLSSRLDQAEQESGQAWTEYNDSENARLAVEARLREAEQERNEWKREA